MGTFIPLFNRHKMVGLAPHFTEKTLFSSWLDGWWIMQQEASLPGAS